MLDTEDLRSTPTLKLELETLDYKVNQLNPIVQRLCGLQSKEFATHLINGEPTITRFVLAGQPKVHAWSGPQDIDGETFDQYEGKSTLNYHVVTLIWNLRFTQIPRAHVPTLRRAPRIGAPQPHPTSGTDFAPPAPRPPSPVQNISAVAKRGAYVNSRLRSSRNDRRGYRHARGLWAKLLWVQKFQDECVHGTARQSFVRQMGPWQVERWSRRWEEQGSLLRFDG